MNKTLHDQIEIIEAGYRFLLAYAAQGREDDTSGGVSEARTTISDMSDASDTIVAELDGDDVPICRVVVDDAQKARAAFGLVLDQEKISSELVDNLNASIHVRALLTDLFLLSETKF